MRYQLPEQGQPWRTLEQKLVRVQQSDLDYEGGVFERYWPAYPSEVYLAARSAQSMFAYTNVFSLADVPSLARIDRELRAMVADILHLPEAGAVTLTGGGTESNFLAMKAARRRGWTRGVERPNVVVPVTAHPSFDKAGDELGMVVRRTPVDSSYRALAREIGSAIDADTVLVAGSAPSYPQGVVDPIADIGEVAADADVWMHVDACVGGFLLPFLRDLDPTVPRFAFDLEPVWSVSADLHKFGLCLNGISTFSVRSEHLTDLHTFTLGGEGWPYRGYRRVGFAGSRPGATLAAAWTTLQSLGREGYRDVARSIRDTSQAIADRASAIPGLRVPIAPEAGIVVLFPEEGVDVEQVSAALLARGWDISTALTPPTLHLLMSPGLEHLVDRLIDDLARSVAEVRAGRPAAVPSRGFEYGD